MEDYLGQALPQSIPEDLDEFLSTPIKCLQDCSNCVRVLADGKTEEIRPCVQTLGSRGLSCDHCRAAHVACDGDFVGKDRLLWMLAKQFREEVLPFEPLEDIPRDPESPEFLPVSPRPGVPGWADAEYEPSELELDELSDGDQQEEEDVHVPVFYDGIPQEVLDFVLAHDLAALAADELDAPAAAPEPEGAQGNPILIDWYVLLLLITSYNMLRVPCAQNLYLPLNSLYSKSKGVTVPPGQDLAPRGRFVPMTSW